MTVDVHLCPVLRSPPLPFRSHRGRYNGIHQVVLGNRYGTAKPCTPVRFWAPPPGDVHKLMALVFTKVPARLLGGGLWGRVSINQAFSKALGIAFPGR